jgi:uncharacterized protein YfaS (alpha-2-macroglobulin family)
MQTPECLGAKKVEQQVAIPANGSLTVPLSAMALAGSGKLLLSVHNAAYREFVRLPISVDAAGFPSNISVSGVVSADVSREAEVLLPASIVPGSLKASLYLQSSPLAVFRDGLEGMLRTPYGCFEQTSSVNFPNVLTLQLIRKLGIHNPKLTTRAHEVIDASNKRLATFQVDGGGFSMFGRGNADEVLTAYGVLQFHEAKRAGAGVDAELIRSARAWLLKRRSAAGFTNSAKYHWVDKDARDAYITWVLASTGQDPLDRQIANSADKALASDNPYLTALALLAEKSRRANSATAQQLQAKLRTMRQPDGHFQGDSGIGAMGSSGLSFEVAATALALLALEDEVSEASVRWLLEQRHGGSFGNTQATVLALKALMSINAVAGRAQLQVNNAPPTIRELRKHQILPALDISELFRTGKNQLLLRFDQAESLPFNVDLSFRTRRPANRPNPPLALTVSGHAKRVNIGDVLDVRVLLANQDAIDRAMTLVHVGVPAGLIPQVPQLQQLRDDGKIDFFELFPGEVILYFLYFNELRSKASQTVHLHLLAEHAGIFTGLASRSYEYYGGQEFIWADPLRVTVTE